MGEILGLTWENVHISDEDIAADNAYVYIDKELTRASKRAIETLGEKDINAQKFETAFYAKPDLRNVRPPEALWSSFRSRRSLQVRSQP